MLDEGGVPAAGRSRARVSRTAADLNSSARCPGMLQIVDGGPVRTTATVASMAEQSRIIVQGVVSDVVGGFFDGVPASVVTVRVERSAGPTGKTVSFVFPGARFVAGNSAFCRDSYPFEAMPVVGDKVLLFGTTTGDREAALFVPRPYELLTEHKGQIRKPVALLDDPDLREESVEAFAHIFAIARERRR